MNEYTKYHKSIVLAIGKSCFLTCNGCYNHFSCEEEIPRENIIDFLKYLKKKYGVTKVTVGGGDPLSRNDISDVLKEIKSLGIFVNLDTTGLPFLYDTNIIFNGHGVRSKIEITNILGSVDVLGLPIDGADEEINQMFRAGRENFLQEELNLLGILEKYNTSVCINTVVHKGNVEQLKAIADLLKPYKNIFKWQLFQFIPSGPVGFLNSNKFIISNVDYWKNIKELQRYIERHKINITLDPKSRTRRKNIYLLIDSNGNAWCPKTSTNKKWKLLDDSTNERIVWGNIRNKEDITHIIEESFSYQGSSISKEE